MKNLKHTILILILFLIPSFIIGNDDIANNDSSCYFGNTPCTYSLRISTAQGGLYLGTFLIP